jgi:Tol biopolymer transport system component
VGTEGEQGDGDSWYNWISYDGRFVSFHSAASTFAGNDTNGLDDAFVYDGLTGSLRCVSVDPFGAVGNGRSQRVRVSGDGQFVAFHSQATNLVESDANGVRSDIFVCELSTGQLTLVSVSSEGEQGNHYSEYPSISADGRYVAFISRATNLIPDDTNGPVVDVFVHDRQTGQTVCASVDSGGVQGNANSFYPMISGNGQFVVFMSQASNLVPNDTSSGDDIFVHDLDTQQTFRVNVDSFGAQAQGPDPNTPDSSNSFYPTIDHDGQRVVFISNAINLVSGDTNGADDIFLHNVSTGLTTRVSIGSAGQEGDDDSAWPRISPDGRYVAFNSYAGNLIAGDTNGRSDIFLRDVEIGHTWRVTRTWNGDQPNGDSRVPAVSERAQFVAWYSEATNLVADDTNDKRDEFLCDRRGDVDADGDIDLKDWVLLADAMEGPGITSATEDADLDNDGDTDVADVAILAANFTGP